MLIATGVDLMFYQHQVTTMNLVLDRKAAEAECYARQSTVQTDFLSSVDVKLLNVTFSFINEDAVVIFCLF